jgi:murein DD-endopeptidase MepM/ murein hydrolase activator NlpD
MGKKELASASEAGSQPDDPSIKSGEAASSTPDTGLSTNKVAGYTGSPTSDRFLSGGAWLLAISLVMLAIYLGWHVSHTAAASSPISEDPLAQLGNATQIPVLSGGSGLNISLPAVSEADTIDAVLRRINPHTLIPTRPREDVITYTVATGDSVFEIARNFNLKPESVLWANYDQLKDSPDMLSPGMVLKIPPVDGVLYEWKDGDNLEGVAGSFSAKADDILYWSGNHLDLTDPKIKPGALVMVPNGKREFVQWVIPTIPRGRAGVNPTVYGSGSCQGGYSGAFGTGWFIWPSGNHVLSGNDYWSGHLGIDIAGALGDGIFAADSGVVVFAGPATGGYGNMVMIDHGNGYQTLYAHMSSVSARCGASVSQGQYIGAIGSTGNSTGPHLHFEIRYGGGFINPWSMLP